MNQAIRWVLTETIVPDSNVFRILNNHDFGLTTTVLLRWM